MVDKALQDGGKVAEYIPDDWVSFPESLVSAYRWHALVPDTFDIRDYKDGTLIKENVDYVDQAFNSTFLQDYGLEEVLVGLASTYAGSLRLYNSPKKLQNFSHRFKLGNQIDKKSSDCEGAVDSFDITMMDIIRDRERGMPRYAEYRRLLGLDAPTKWEHITKDKETIKLLKEVYDDDIDKVDIIVGALAEDRIEEIEDIPSTFEMVILSTLANVSHFLVSLPVKLEFSKSNRCLRKIGCSIP